MDPKSRTTQTYLDSAEALAKKFDAMEPRVGDIDEAFALVPRPNPFVLEIGCCNGRDAAEILKRTDRYLGIDISSALIAMARERLPGGAFEVADVATFTFPQGIDIVFAFASLIHEPKESLRTIFTKLHAAMGAGGVMRISLKYAEAHEERTKDDEFGTRTYYFYSPDDVRDLLQDFAILKNDMHEIRGQTWLEILVQK
jgi:SAM-dependent methyltransferase